MCTGRILTNGLFLKDETKKAAANGPFGQREEQTKQKYFNVHRCARCSYIIPLVSFSFSQMPVIYFPRIQTCFKCVRVIGVSVLNRPCSRDDSWL